MTPLLEKMAAMGGPPMNDVLSNLSENGLKTLEQTVAALVENEKAVASAQAAMDYPKHVRVNA